MKVLLDSNNNNVWYEFSYDKNATLPPFTGTYTLCEVPSSNTSEKSSKILTGRKQERIDLATVSNASDTELKEYLD